jgi:hypothetical protein
MENDSKPGMDRRFSTSTCLRHNLFLTSFSQYSPPVEMLSIQMLLSKRWKGTTVVALVLVVGALTVAIWSVPPKNRNQLRGKSSSADAHFEIVNGTTASNVVAVVLSNAAVIDVQKTFGNLEMLDIHVRITNPVEFVEFSHNGVENISRSFINPYSICAGMAHNHCLGLFEIGEHTIVATPFSRVGPRAGESFVVSYVIVDPAESRSLEMSPDESNDPADEELARVSCGTPMVSD